MYALLWQAAYRFPDAGYNQAAARMAPPGSDTNRVRLLYPTRVAIAD
jgi:hypothetical protein